ncbi:MAG: hypothetical protein OXU36_08185 [Candidatus Poribacteria bacterium]|nr:hypothetical protein [Candidatus Poribacteria bacterium]
MFLTKVLQCPRVAFMKGDAEGQNQSLVLSANKSPTVVGGGISREPRVMSMRVSNFNRMWVNMNREK